MGLTVNSGATQETPEKRPQTATCQQSFVKLGLNGLSLRLPEPPAKNGGSLLDHQTTGVLGGESGRFEPISEADLPPEQYAYRPGRNAQQAVVDLNVSEDLPCSMFHLICNKLSPQRTICRPFLTYSPRKEPP